MNAKASQLSVRCVQLKASNATITSKKYVNPSASLVFDKLKQISRYSPLLSDYVKLYAANEYTLMYLLESIPKLLSTPDEVIDSQLSPVVAVLSDVMSALEYLNEHDVFHGLLSPESIGIHYAPEGELCTKITDFGLRDILKELTPATVEKSVKNLRFIPPEAQCEDGLAYDIWSFGALIVYLLSRQTRFTEQFAPTRDLDNDWRDMREEKSENIHAQLEMKMTIARIESIHMRVSEGGMSPGWLVEWVGSLLVLPVFKHCDTFECAYWNEFISLAEIATECLCNSPHERVSIDVIRHYSPFNERKIASRVTGERNDCVLQKPWLSLPSLADCEDIDNVQHFLDNPLAEGYERYSGGFLGEIPHSFSWEELVYLWEASGGDPGRELVRQGLEETKRCIDTIPIAFIRESDKLWTHVIGYERDSKSEEASVVFLPIIPLDMAPLMSAVSRSFATSNEEPQSFLAQCVSQVVKLKELFRFYPVTSKEIIECARYGIPAIYRSYVWAAVFRVNYFEMTAYRTKLVNMKGRLEHLEDFPECFDVIERQIDRDILRCQEHHRLLITDEARQELKNMLQAWVVSNPEFAYWQGIDSICAVFVAVYFSSPLNSDAMDSVSLGYCVFTRFIEHYADFFILDEMAEIRKRWLNAFSGLLCYHDPSLSAHFQEIGFNPEIYALPWFLSMFTNIFPIEEILVLWDSLLLGTRTFPFFVAIAILMISRDMLLQLDIDGCVMFKANSISVDIAQIIERAFELFENTPEGLVEE